MSSPDDHFLDRFRHAYYQTGKNTIGGQLALGRCAVSIANEFSSDFPNFSVTDIAALTLESLLKAPEASQEDEYNPLKIAGVDILSAAAANDIPIFIWTVGDTGKYVDATNDIDDPAFEYQRRKIELSKIQEKVARRIGNSDYEFHINPSAESKESSLYDIFNQATIRKATQIFVADDLPSNEELVRNVARDFPELEIQFWLIKGDEDTAGNLAAFRDFVVPQLQQGDRTHRSFLVMDWDETLFNTQASLNRAAQLMSRKIHSRALT